MANATIEAELSGSRAYTDSEGNYSLLVFPGKDYITVLAPHYRPQFKEMTIKPGQSARANFTLLSGVGGPCYLHTLYTVDGRVVDGSGPVRGARVWIWNTRYESVTDENGEYSIENACGELILAEVGNQRGGVVVRVPSESVVTAPTISLRPP